MSELIEQIREEWRNWVWSEGQFKEQRSMLKWAGMTVLRPRDQELVGEEWRIRAKDRRRNWTLLVVIIVREN